ncbi:PAS domain S-box protein [Halobacteria archaeon AArc-m2/3/4]|uniref:histidine kinase n=1 Tax=Natronoglomus mannanivorans TaxID=2979990 RepID=A0ABT2QCZ1_9EURY|nr:PAS domain S-box protein [Halobacteria archaeon AArc-m2/3/4]
MASSIRVLYVHDGPDVADSTVTALDHVRTDDRFTVTTTTSASDGLDRLEADETFDCVVSAYDMPGLDGIEFLAAVRETHPELPFVLIAEAETGSEAVASEAISNGVSDYLHTEFTSGRLLATRIEAHVERARTRRERERSRELLQHTEQLSETGGWEADAETGEQRWTDGTYRIHGLSPGSDFEPTVDSGIEFYHPDDRDRIEALVRRCMESGEPYDEELRLVTADDRLRWVRTTGEAITENGSIVKIRGAIQDVTERKEREHALQRSHEEYQQLINGMNETAWVIDFDENFRAVNEAAVEMLGYSRAELLSMTPHDIDAGLEPGEITALIADMPEDEIQVFETIHETSDGDQIPVEISSSLIHYRGETAVLSVARDISNRKEREQELQRQKDRLDEFASVVSHDLRNPLTVATGRLELAREDCDSEHLADLEWALDRMDELIDDLLTLARKGEQVSEFEPVALEELAADCWQHVETPRATLEIEAETDRTILADRSRLQQLVENLFRNAVEHGGDDVTVTVGSLEDDAGFYVEDDGVGIPPTDREVVFETGHSSSSSSSGTGAGTGFGLRIVEQVVDAHDWAISVTDGAEGGARFEITGVEMVE